MNKTYFVYNAYEFTNKEGKETICMEANNTKFASRYPKKFFFTKEELYTAGFTNFYDPQKKGLGLEGIYLKTKSTEEIVGASDKESELD